MLMANYISAKDKDVIVIGGGDTGTDCIGTSLRPWLQIAGELRTVTSPTMQRVQPTIPGLCGHGFTRTTTAMQKPQRNSVRTQSLSNCEQIICPRRAGKLTAI